MSKHWLIGAAAALAAGGAFAQTNPPLTPEAAQTQIEVHQGYRSDGSGTSSSIGTRVQRPDGSGRALEESQSVRNPAPPPVVVAPSTTTTTEQSTTTWRR